MDHEWKKSFQLTETEINTSTLNSLFWHAETKYSDDLPKGISAILAQWERGDNTSYKIISYASRA